MITLASLNLRAESGRSDKQFFDQHQGESKLDLELSLASAGMEYQALLKKVDDYLVLFDDGIKSVIGIHEICNRHHSKTQKGFAFVVLSSKMIGLLLGIRNLIYSGLPDCAKSLNRSLIESMDIFYACIANSNLSNAFAAKDKIYDNNSFYRKHFSKGKLKRECEELFDKISMTPENMEYMKGKRKHQHSFLSESVHSSFNAAFTSYMMCTLELEFSHNYYGKVTTAYPNMLIRVIEDIYIFNYVFYSSIKERASVDLDNVNFEDCAALIHYRDKFRDLYEKNQVVLHKQSEEYSLFFNEVLNHLNNTSANSGQ